MTIIKRSLRWLTPLGLIERHRRHFQMHRLGLPGTHATEQAVSTCRFDLWPLSLRQPIKPWVLVDVGANDGEFSSAAAQLVPLAGVHAFEPQPSCHTQLNHVLEKIPNSKLHAVAVGDGPGEIDLLCTSNSKLSSVLRPDTSIAEGYEAGDFTVQQRITVPMVRLDDTIPAGTNIGLLKIDVQGFEIPVLAGAREILKSTQALLMEVNYVPHYEGGATFDKLHETVRSYGFQTFGISAPYGGPNGPLWADAMFVRT